MILGRRVKPRDERGATILVVVLALVAIFGMVVLVVDIGGALVVRRQMVRSADSAALAAAMSFALRDASCGDPLTEPLAQQQAVQFVTANQTGTTLTSFSTNCDESTVTVGVESSARQFIFAPVIGGPSQRNVHATATALWGPLGGGNAVPIVLDSGTLQGQCKVPDGIAEGETCAFWYDNSDLGDASWGFMNLDLWDVPADANCSNAGAADRSEWIINGYLGDVLSLNGPPEDTFVCVDTGHSQRDWFDLKSQEGEVKLFPVNDCDGSVADTGQVDKDGNPAPCPATPDKYDIIGFTKLKILHVYKGDDPLAVGDPGASGTCNSPNYDIPPGAVINLDSFAGTGGNCPPTAPDNIPYGGVHIYRGATEFTKCSPTDPMPCDYRYDETAPGHPVTWLLGNVNNARVVFDWSFDGTAGACPNHAPDPNAICLVTEWVGYQAGPGPIGGIDLGARGVRLLK